MVQKNKMRQQVLQSHFGVQITQRVQDKRGEDDTSLRQHLLLDVLVTVGYADIGQYRCTSLCR